MGRTPVVLLVALISATSFTAATTGAAAEPAPPTGWDGAVPFNCVVQQAGFEATGPDPAADPYCVEFDKRRQNITELGVVDFLSKEPARVAAALDKCFYFQSDHWRGSIVQEDGSTKTYEWDGHYFFDKAHGEGGVWVSNFNVNGRTEDPSKIPGIPPEYAQHFGPGTGGVRTRNAIDADPNCIAKAQERPPYPPPPAQPSCHAAAGGIGPGVLGPLALGDREPRVRELLGPPARVHRGFLRYCVQGGGKLLVGQTGDRSGESGVSDEPSRFLLTTHPAYRFGSLRRGARWRRGAVRGARLRVVVGHTRVYDTGRGVLVGVLAGRVRFFAVTDTRTARSAASVRAWLRRSA